MSGVKLRRIATAANGAGFPHASQGKTSGDLPFFKVSDFHLPGNERYLEKCTNWVTRSDAVELGARVVSPKSILLPKVGAALLGNARRIATRPSVFDNNILAIVPRVGDSRYLHYWMTTLDARELSYPGPVPSLTGSAFLDLLVPIDAELQQRAIADFLDAETVRIDALIAKKHRMYSAIEERFKSERDQQVRHLMAEHGSTGVRRLVDGVEQGWSPSCEDRTAGASEWGVLKTSAVTEGTFKGAENKRLPDDLQPDFRWGVEDGDVLVARGSGSIKRVGTAAVAATEGRNLLISDLIYRLVHPRMKPALLAHCINSSVGRTNLESSIRTDVGQTLKIRGDDLLDTPVPSVPPKLQAEALDAIERRLRLARETVERLSAQLALLAEHRQALITAAVTGQIEVPEARAISR